MKKLCVFVIIITAVIFTGCGASDADSEPANGAAMDLQARFADMFEDSKDEPATAGGTLRFEENTTEPATASGPAPAATEPPIVIVIAPTAETTTGEGQPEEHAAEVLPDDLAEIILNIISNMDDETLDSIRGVSNAVQEERFVATPSGRRYHVEGCHHAQNVREHLTRTEAESQGLEPCRTCNP
jgi:hypothetical protein